MVDYNTDIVIVGGGNAALVSAITACERNKSVLVLEAAPEFDRGGNSKYVRDFRIAHKSGEFGIPEEYSAEEFMDELIRVTRGETNKTLARLVIECSPDVIYWAMRHGVRIMKSITGTLHLTKTNVFILGGGKALLNAYYHYLDRLSKNGRCRVLYGHKVVDIEIENREFKSLIVEHDGRKEKISADTLILASGGFESNINVLKEYWGDAANNFIIRGTHHNTGLPLLAMMRHNASTIGRGDDGHMVAVDARSPRFNGGIVTRVDSIIFGIVVNKFGNRFYDEGEDLWPKRYAVWGKLIARQPTQIAFSIFDSKVWSLFIPPFNPPIVADTIDELAGKLVDFGLENPNKLIETIIEFNRACPRNKKPDFSMLDGISTSGIKPPKSNWAMPIDAPPFYAYPLKPGLTFTYLSLRVDEHARVLDSSGNPFNNIFAAGEIMAGNILTNGYLGGLGLVIGTVFGWIAGNDGKLP